MPNGCVSFQSTHPRGVRPKTRSSPVAKNTFQSTHPRGVRPYHNYSHSLYCPFQSTHPVWGATCVYARPPRSHEQFQSTHPVWGATDVSILVVGMIADFNPRTPYGVRLRSWRLLGCGAIFQSTHPVWGATCHSVKNYTIKQHFNPRTPYGVRHAPLNLI